MATDIWVGGAGDPPDQGRYDVADDWSGDAVPQAGDTVDITGVAVNGLSKIGQIITFPIDGDYTSLYLFPRPAHLGEPVEHPGKLKGELIADQTIDINGEAGPPQLWLQNTSLSDDTISVIGTAVFETYLSNTISGTLTIGAGATTGLLQMVLVGADTAGVGIRGRVAETTLAGEVSVGAGSTFDVEALSGNGLLAVNIQNTGTMDVAAGGTLVIDDEDGSSPDTAYDHGTKFFNNGVVQITGQSGAVTSALFDTNVVGTGTIDIAGNGATAGATTVEFEGNVTGENLVVSDATVTIQDAQFAIDDGTNKGFAVSGGSFTFAGDATLVLHQPSLTDLEFRHGRLQEVPNGQHPFTTPIYGFADGDTIDLVGHYLEGFQDVLVWNPTTQILQVESPAVDHDNPPTIIAKLQFEGSYVGSGFAVSPTNVHGYTGDLDLTYSAPAAATLGAISDGQAVTATPVLVPTTHVLG